MKTTWIAWICVLTACGGKAAGSDAQGSDASQPPDAKSAIAAGTLMKDGTRNACRLLTNAEVEVLVEEPVGMASVEEAMPAYSKCQWENAKGIYLFGIEVWWAGGKQQWDIWGQATKVAGAMLEKAEGVPLDSAVPQGPVSGIGDAAVFSEIMPARILQGDRTIEMNLALVPRAAVKFRGLAQTILSRM